MKPSIAIIGAGMGGLTVAATLRLVGFDVRVYEQAARFASAAGRLDAAADLNKIVRALTIERRRP